MLFLQIILALFTTMSFAQEEERTPSQAPRVGEISSEDQERVRTRVNTLNLSSISFGPGWASDINNDDLFYVVHLGRNWEVSTNAEIRLNFDGAFASKNEGNWLSGTIGAGWLMSVEDISPVIGAEFGYGYAHADALPDPAGFVLGGFAGVRFFRSATAQMSLEAYFQTILKNDNPVLSGLRIGILF